MTLDKEKEPTKGPLKFDKEKLRVELVPPELIKACAEGLSYGVAKYGAGNWTTEPGFEYSRLYGGLQRHLLAWASGEDTDSESGNAHLSHAACMLAFLIAHIQRGYGTDDRVAVGMSVAQRD